MQFTPFYTRTARDLHAGLFFIHGFESPRLPFNGFACTSTAAGAACLTDYPSEVNFGASVYCCVQFRNRTRALPHGRAHVVVLLIDSCCILCRHQNDHLKEEHPMARRKTPEPPQPPLELAVPIHEAERKIGERIAAGEALIADPAEAMKELQQTKESYYKWDSYNTELLKRLFTNTEPADEYSFFGIASITMNPTPAEEFREVHKGVQDKIHRLDSIRERLELIPEASSVSPMARDAVQSGLDMGKVFLVHGHDSETKLSVARFIEKLGFEAVILHEKASQGMTIIEKIEANSDVGFGVVLYTPCDVGGIKPQAAEAPELNDRARQNVVLEHGYLMGKLGRNRVAALVKGSVEKPNDISGVVYIPFDSPTVNWEIDLAKELRQAGYSVDMNKII